MEQQSLKLAISKLFKAAVFLALQSQGTKTKKM